MRRRGNRNFRICTCICRVKHGSAVFGAWSDADWNAWVQERKENSIIFGSGEEKEVQKILTLSTCIGDGSSSQRLAVHAAVEMIFATKSGREEGSVLE